MKKIAIIPARGGSKRIPRKNIRPFLGKPIIAYSIEAALSSGLFDEVMVSTDDKEIADVARSLGAEVPFFRSSQNADDFATTFDVIQEVIEQYKEKGRSFDYTCCLYPTAPFVTAHKLREAFSRLQQEEVEAVFPVLEFSYPIQRALQFQDGQVHMIWPENLKKRSQDLPKCYHDTGQFYFYHTQTYLQKKAIFVMKTSAIVVSPLEAQDIDNESDWQLAEWKVQLMQKT
jgi:pseudaminic acid cytidylyltransferase